MELAPTPSRTARRSVVELAHRAALALCVAACVFFACRGAWRALREGGNDFTIYYRAGEAVLAHADPYADRGFIYLPVFAVLMAPFAALPYAVAVCVWQALSLAATLWAARRCAQLATPIGESISPWLTWLPLACALRLVDSNLGNGQVNAITLALVLEGCVALRSDRAARAALWFAAGAVIKLLPGFALAWCVLRGRWRAALLGGASATALALLLPAAAMGPRASIESLERWWSQTAQPYDAGGAELLAAREYLPGQSLIASGYRMLSAAPATSLGSRGPRANFLELDPDVVAILLQIAVALQVAVFAITVWRRPARPGTRDFAVEAALALCTVLLVAPLVHKAHMMWLMLAFAALLSSPRGWRARVPSAARAVLIALGFALIGLTTPALAGRALSAGSMSHNALLFGAEALFAALVIDRWSAREHAPAAAVNPTRRRAPRGAW